MSKPERYHPWLVSLHWLSAALIIFMLLAGSFFLKRIPNNEEKLLPLAMHALIGGLILVLTSIRLVVRLTKPLPAPATTGSRLLDVIGHITHWVLYLGAFGMGISGLGIALRSGLFGMLRSGTWTLEGGFYQFAPRLGHQYVAWGLGAVILLHIAAALFHQVIRRDGIFRRMAFGRRGR